MLKRIARRIGLLGVYRALWRGGWAAFLTSRGAVLRPLYVPRAAPPRAEDLSSILILRPDHIGDMIQTTPLLRALKEAFPGARLSVLASPSNARVLLNNPHVDEALVADEPLYSFLPDSARTEAFDLLVDPSLADREYRWPELARRLNCRWRLGYDLRGGRARFYNLRVPPPAPDWSAARTMLELCRRGLDRPLAAYPPALYLSDEERGAARRRLAEKGLTDSSRLILLHPGGAFDRKCWPAERFADLADLLRRRRNVDAVLVGGPADAPLLERARARRPALSRLECPDLRLFMAIVAEARLLICNNSGPLHVAVALGVPTVSTYWADQYAQIRALWVPREPIHRVVEKDSLRDLGVDEMAAQVESALSAGTPS